MWASQSIARSPAPVGLISGYCSSARAFAPRFFQAPPRGECDFTLALRYDFTSIRLSKGLSPSSCQACSAHNKKARREPCLLNWEGQKLFLFVFFLHRLDATIVRSLRFGVFQSFLGFGRFFGAGFGALLALLVENLLTA